MVYVCKQLKMGDISLLNTGFFIIIQITILYLITKIIKELITKFRKEENSKDYKIISVQVLGVIVLIYLFVKHILELISKY